MHPTALAHGKETKARVKIRDLNTQIAVTFGSVFCMPLKALLCCIVKLVELRNKYYVIKALKDSGNYMYRLVEYSNCLCFGHNTLLIIVG
jgi:hypothetical protein